MSNLNLGGFDVVVHLGESAINQGLELLPSGSTFPVRERQNVTFTALGVPIPGVGTPTKNVPLIYDAFVELERPHVTLDQANGGVTIRCDLSPASQLTFLRTTLPADTTLLTGVVPQIALAGSIQLDCPFGTADLATVWGGQAVAGRAAVARAGGVSAVFSLTIPLADATGNVVIATAVVGATPVQVASAAITPLLDTAMGTNIGNKIGDLPLTNPVRLNAGATPVQTVRDVSAAISPLPSPAAISLGVLTGIEPQSTGGVVPPPPAAFDATNAVVGIANYWTLHLVCTALRTAHSGMTFTINQNPPRASFSGAVTIPGGDEPLTIRQLDITVNSAGGLAVAGHATASGSCWDATVDFDFNFTFTCDPDTGAVVAGASPPNVDVDVDKDWLCIIIGIVVGAVGGFIVGAIVGVLVSGSPWGALIGGGIGAVVGGIGGYFAADALIDPLSLDGVSLDSLSVLGGLTLPLPVGGAGLLVQLCDFDDLQVIGRPVYVDLAERHRAGTTHVGAGTGFDLDSGIVRPVLQGVTDDVADLFWNGNTLATLPGAVIGPVFASDPNAFGMLSLTDLEGFTYFATSLGNAQIPIWFPLSWPFGLSGKKTWLSFAVRTDQGRYAKCRVLRDLFGNLTLEYVVYARPSMCLGTLVTLDTLSKTVVDSGTEWCIETRSETVSRTPTQIDLPSTVPPRAPASVRMQTEHQLSPAIFHPASIVGVADLLAGFRPPRPPCGPELTVEQHEADWALVDRAQRAMIQALPTGVVAPLTFRWNVFGTDIPTGSGSVAVGPIDVTHDENSPILTLMAQEGDDLIGSVRLTAIDLDGRILRAHRYINSPSRKKLGGCCGARPAKITLPDAVQRLTEASDTARIFNAGALRLRHIAATGRVTEMEAIPLREVAKPPARNNLKNSRTITRGKRLTSSHSARGRGKTK